MPTPKGGYFVGKQKVPSVTTILSRFKESGGLIHWAWKLGTEGKDYRAERDGAASIGTQAHRLVEDHINNVVDREWEADPAALAAYGAYLDWERHTKLRILRQELGMVSKTHLFGGTLDAVGMIDGELCLLDWKTSNSVYPDYICQLAAYIILFNENNFPPIEGGAHLLRFSKEHGDFHHHYYKDLQDAKESFLLMRTLYDRMSMLEKRVK